MFGGRYSKFLTISLIVVIVLIVAGLGFLIYGIVTDNRDMKNRDEAIAKFDAAIIGDVQNDIEEEDVVSGNNEIVAPDPVNTTQTNNKPKKQYYEDYVMLGYIEIKKTNIKYPILEKATAKALDIAVAVTYPSNPKLNEPGNVVIAGHNYRNKKAFSNNSKLSAGDKIYITSNDGRKLTYTVYEKFETDASDTEYMLRNTNGGTEISLTTCSANDSNKRLIILAKVE